MASQKTCSRCGRKLPVEKFYKDKRVCNNCRYVANKKTVSSGLRPWLQGRLRVARKNSSKRGVTVEIDENYLISIFDAQNERCAVTGLPMTFDESEYAISIDRLDNSKGYVEGNVRLICRQVNLMRNTLTPERFQWWCKVISNNAED